MRRWSDGGEEIDEQLVFRFAADAVKHGDRTLITEQGD
jgi:hypothetical protein